ncbi:MAG: hypothetical protein ACK6D3_23595, partial [Planctomycetaceae bacterium]
IALSEQKNQKGTRWVEGWVAPLIRPLASFSPLEEEGPFAARWAVWFLSTDGTSVDTSYRVGARVGDGDLG